MSSMLPLAQIAYTKVVQSGDLIEVYDYEKEPTQKRFKRTTLLSRKRRGPRRRSKRHMQRAKNNFRRMVRASLGFGAPAFCTLTMVSVETIGVAYKEFSKFTTNLRRAFGSDIKWVAVPEYQKRGAVHFHALIWGLHDEIILTERDSRNLQALWGRGWLDILKSDGSPKLASYLAKYMFKALSDERLIQQKSYTASRGMLRPVCLNTPASIAFIESEYPEIRAIDSEIPDSVYSTEFLGKCRYRKIVINRSKQS